MRAAEGVDRSLRVGGGEHQPAVGHEGANQAELGRVEVGDVVDQHRAVALPHRCHHLGIGQQDSGPVHELGVVEGGLGVEHVEVLGEELPDRHPLRQVGPAAVLDDVLGVEAELAGTGEHRAHLAGETAGGQRLPQPAGPARTGVSCEQFTHPELLLGGGQQPPVAGGRVLVDQRAGKGVDGRHGELRGAPYPFGDPVPQRAGRGPGRGEHQRRPARAHPLDGGLRHEVGLAGSRPAEHEQRAVPAPQRRGLFCRQPCAVHDCCLRHHATHATTRHRQPAASPSTARRGTLDRHR